MELIRKWIGVALLLSLGSATPCAVGATYVAGPTNYHDAVRGLKAGDTLSLLTGEYRGGLKIHGLHGQPGRPIVIRGPKPGATAAAVFVA